MAQQTRNPTGDGTFTGTWDGTPGSRWAVVDDHPDSAGADLLTHGTTTAGRGPFTYSAFTVNPLACIQSVQVLYYDRKDASQANSWGAYLRVNGSDRAVIDAHNLTNGSWVLRTATSTTNPATSARWTVADVNGTGTQPLQQFGVVATDVSPACKLASIQLVVNYIDPLTADVDSHSQYAITGTAATLKRGLPVTPGSYTVTGTTATLKIALAATSGSYTVSGQVLDFRYFHLAVDSGTYEIVGAASINAYGILASNGTYSLTGTDATLTTAGNPNKVLAVDSGVYTSTGRPAGLTPLYTGGSYTYTGVSVVLAVKISASGGSYSINGSPVGTTPSYSSGTYTLTGKAVTFTPQYAHGIYVLTGVDTTLTWSGGAAPEIHLLACMGYGR